MIADLRTVLWKEWRELLALRGTFQGGWIGLLVVVGALGVYLPYRIGRDWVDSPAAHLYWIWIPLFLVASTVAESFAGERERHTLETLLASRLSDRAILLGKIASTVSYGWGASIILLLLGLVTVNVAHGREGPLMLSPLLGLSIVLLTFLGSLLVASAGVLVSLYASTVRQAAQILSVGAMLVLFVPLLGAQALPEEVKLSLVRSLTGGTITINVIFGTAAVLVVLDAVLLLVARARFRRARLILS